MQKAEQVDAENPSGQSDGDTWRKDVETKEKRRVLSIDTVTVEKFVLESWNESRQVFLSKNESSRKLWIESDGGKGLRTKDERKESSEEKHDDTCSQNAFASESMKKVGKANEDNAIVRSLQSRIKPIKLTKCPTIGSIVVAGFNWKDGKSSKVIEEGCRAGAVHVQNSDKDKRSEKDGGGEDRLESLETRPDIDSRGCEVRGTEGRRRVAEAKEGIIRDDNDKLRYEKGGKDDGKAAEIKKEKIVAKNRLKKSESNIGLLQENLGTGIDANTAEKYKKKLLELGALKSPITLNSKEKLAGDFAFDQELLRKYNLDERLKIEEKLDSVWNGEEERLDEESRATRESAKPRYCKRVSEIERRWSGGFLAKDLVVDRRSSESSYVEEFGSVSSRESVTDEQQPSSAALLFKQGKQQKSKEISDGGREEIFADSAVSTVDSDSCFEDRIKAVEEDIGETGGGPLEDDGAEEAKRYLSDPPRNRSNLEENGRGSEKVFAVALLAEASSTDSVDVATFVARNRWRKDGYAILVRELAMEAGSSRPKKEEKQPKKKLGLRRLLPGFFSPKDSRKEYKKKESKERKRHDDRHFARYQQNGIYTMSPDTMNLNEDIKRNVRLDNSLNGSIIEERLDEIKRELFADQGPITSTPDHLSRDGEQSLLRDRAGHSRSYATDSSLSSIAPDERWNASLGISPDIRKFEQRQKREEFGQRYGHLERKHSLQEPNRTPYFFHRNHGPSGRISAPPSERYLVRPRAIHPMDRPLPAIPHSRMELSTNCDNYLEEEQQLASKSDYANDSRLYENGITAPEMMLKSVAAQVKITRQPIVNQKHRAALVGRSPKYPSPGSSHKSGDYGDSSCTPNSSQKSEFSPSSSKSGEYYLHSPRNSGSPNGKEFGGEDDSRREDGIYENEKTPSRSSTRCAEERVYEGTSSSSSPPSPPCASHDGKQFERVAEDSSDKIDVAPTKPSTPKSVLGRNAAKLIGKDGQGRESSTAPSSSSLRGKSSQDETVTRAFPSPRRAQPNEQILIASPKREVAYETRIPRTLIESSHGSPINAATYPTYRERISLNRDPYGNQNSAGPVNLERSSTAHPKPEQRQDRDDRFAVPQGQPFRPSSRCPQKRRESAKESAVDRSAAQPTKDRFSAGLLATATERPMQNNQSPATTGLYRLPRISGQGKSSSIANLGEAREQRLEQYRQPSSPPSLEEAAIYVQRVSETVYGQRGNTTSPLSPSKRVTRQHLEAFYWQQKALEARRKSLAPPLTGTPPKQITGRKIDLPEVREAVYWQQLKKLNQEQQRRIYEENLLEEDEEEEEEQEQEEEEEEEETPYCKEERRAQNWTKSTKSTAIARGFDPTTTSISSAYVDPWNDSLVRRSKGNPSGKPPLMLSQKGQNQPVLIVRPQQAIRDRRDLLPPDPNRQETRPPERSKSASPHLHRRDPSYVPTGKAEAFAEESNELTGKGVPPPPIFKRGSLVAGDSVEYGSTGGAKRVSFSNQSAAGQDLPSGSWPTKRGTAPEPPTRSRRSEDSVSDTDVRQECRLEAEYDADKPLPPLPKEYWYAGTRFGATNNGWNSSGPVDTDQTRPTVRETEEEWNPDGKGRQSHDTGGSARGESEGGPNEISGGRRGGGVGSGSILGSGGGGSGGRSGGNSRSRDEPRRHTLGGDHQPSLHHQQFNAAQQLHPLHPHHLPPPHGQYGTPPTRHTTMDLEMGTKSRQRKSPLPRGYPPPSSTMLFDDDPGIMSEVETSSTGFRRGGKQRSSLPVVRTPSKTLERPLGLVFLQYRNETKRALLPNEITSIDTVKALFVRSFPKQLTMEYLDSPHVKVYIHDSNKDMFYELEDLRSHLRDIRDRSVLRLFESSDGVTGGGMSGPLGIPGTGTGLPPHWEDQSYFSEPEFDSEYQHQHIHKSKTAKNSTSGSSGYYVGGSSTLPRGVQLMRAYSPAASSVIGGPNATPTQAKALATPGGGGVPPAKPLRNYQCCKSPPGGLGGSARFSRDSSVSLYSIPDRLHGESGYMSSPERSGGVGSGTGRYPTGPYSAGSSYEDPYYSQYSGTVTPVIDEEASDTELLEESYSLYGVKPPGRPPSGPPRSPFPPGAPPPLPPGGQSYDATRIRVEHMERQLANLTGLVQKALTHAPHTSPSPRDYLQVPAARDPYARGPGAGDEFDKHSSSSSASLPDDSYLRTDVKPPKLGKDKSVSFEKSVSFSDEPPDMNSPKQHSPQHAADTKPTKPAIKSSTLPRMSSQERERHKPTPPPKPAALVAGQYVYRDLALTPEMYNQLRGLQKKAKDLRQEVRNLRRMSQQQAHTVRETIRDTFITIRAMLLSGGDAAWSTGDAEKIRLSREEDLYKQEMLRLEKDLTELESTVEELRGNVINKKTRVNMSDVENMALILSKSSKTVADLKVRFPSLQEGMKGLLSSEMEKVVREEKFLKEEPERLESALRRCKKLTGTLVTLKRLASVQEQRLPNAASVDAEETPPITPTSTQHSKAAAPVPAERTAVGSASVVGGGAHPHEPSTAHQQRPENALDALLDELQTFSRPSSQLGHVQGSSAAADLLVARSAVSRETAPSGGTGGGSGSSTRAPCISDIGRKGSIDSSSGAAPLGTGAGAAQNAGGTLRRLHSYPSSSDTDTSPPIARLQVSLQEQPSLPTLPQGFVPGQKPPVPERNAELLQLASARRVPPPPPPRTSSRSPLASPTSPQLPPRNHGACNLQSSGNVTLRRAPARGSAKEGKPPMALPPDASTAILADPAILRNSSSSQSSAVLSTSNSSSCESVNSQEGLQGKKGGGGRQEQLEQRHQELLRKQKALQEQYARLQQLQRNTTGLTTVPPAPPDLLKKTGSESNLLAKMGLGMSAASSGSLTSLAARPAQEVTDGQLLRQEDAVEQQNIGVNLTTDSNKISSSVTANSVAISNSSVSSTATTTSKIYETDIL